MKTTFSFICLIAFSLLSFSTSAQGEFDLRFVHNSLDCSSQKVFVDIEVKATGATTIFNLADQNYRFSFNDAVTNPKIAQELEVSGNVSNGLFNPHNLTGTTGKVVSYNVVLAGGDGFPINNLSWTSVGRISFDIVDPNGKMELVWHDNQPENFPPTFISEEKNSGIRSACRENIYTNYSNAKLDESNCDENLNPISDLFPNPVSGNDNITLKFMNQNPTLDTKLVVTSIDGKFVAEQNISLTEGMNSIEYNAQNLPTGVYMIQIKDAKWQSKSSKFVKID